MKDDSPGAPAGGVPSRAAFSRVLLKVSGEAFGNGPGGGIAIEDVDRMARHVHGAQQLGCQIAIVVGGGNLLRGAHLASHGVNRATADYMGMLATVMNALALQDGFERQGVATRVLSAIPIQAVCEPYVRRRAVRHLEKERIVILAGGTGNPYITTDTAAALRATELGADVLLKATQVDGVYSADPKRDEGATLYRRISFREVLDRGLRVMDQTAFTLCRENRMPILVFNLHDKGSIERVIRGDDLGTRIDVEA